MRKRDKRKKRERLRAMKSHGRDVVRFTEAETKIVHRAAQAVWEEIAYDILMANDADGETDGTMPRAEVIEVVADAGRLEEKIRVLTRQDGCGADLVAKVRALGPEDVERVLAPAFPHDTYGL